VAEEDAWNRHHSGGRSLVEGVMRADQAWKLKRTLLQGKADLGRGAFGVGGAEKVKGGWEGGPDRRKMVSRGSGPKTLREGNTGSGNGNKGKYEWGCHRQSWVSNIFQTKQQTCTKGHSKREAK